MVNSGYMRINKVERSWQEVYEGKRGRTRLNCGKRDASWLSRIYVDKQGRTRYISGIQG